MEVDQPDPDGAGPETAPVSRTSYDANGNQVSSTDPLGNVTTIAYDALNRKTTVTQPDPDGAGAQTSPVTQFGYDLGGNVITTTDPLGHVTSDVYDGLNRKTAVTQADPDGAGPLASPVTHAGYDPVGNQLSATDALGQTTSFGFDNLNRKISQSLPDPDGAGAQSAPVTTFSYDADGNLLQTTDSLGFVTTDSYDHLNRKTAETQPDPDDGGPLPAPVTSYDYDADGNILTRTDPDGNTTSYLYDALNRQTAETNQLGQTETLAYDADGNIASDVDRDGRQRDYVYDHLDRKTAEQWLDGSGNIIRTISSAYDAKGRVSSQSDADSSESITYDRLDRVVSVDNAGTAGEPDVVLGVGYDADGNRTSLSTSVGGSPDFVNAYTYDALNRLTSLTQSGAGTADKRVDFAYDADGRYTTIGRYNDLGGVSLVASGGYSYDADNRLTGLNYANNGGSIESMTWDFDADARIIAASDADGSTSYGYDNDGQLLGASGTAKPTEGYSYDAAGNRTNSGYATQADNRLSSDGTYSYAYDGEGNLTSRTTIATGESIEFTWDDRDRLSDLTFKDANGVVTSRVHYLYDTSDRRTGEQVDSNGDGNYDSTERYIYDPDGSMDNLLLVLDGSGTVTHRYLQGTQANQALADEDTSKSSSDPQRVTWLLSDHQQSTRDVIDNTGSTIDHLTYDSYGNVVSQTNAAAAPRLQYTGMQADAASGGLLYDFHRYYDPGTGRFISQDPKGFAAGDDDLYRYVGNSPVTRVDPSGLMESRNQVWDEAKQEVIQKYDQHDGDRMNPTDAKATQQPYDTDSQFRQAVDWTHGKKEEWYQDHNAQEAAEYQSSHGYDGKTGFWTGFEAGNLNVADKLTFGQFDSLHSAREDAWIGMRGTATETLSNGLTYLGGGALGAAGVLELGGAAGLSAISSTPLGSGAISQLGAEAWTLAASGSPVAYKTLTGLVSDLPDEINSTQQLQGIASRLPPLSLNNFPQFNEEATGAAAGESGGINYGALDELGRPTGINATITPDMIGTGTPANPRIIPPGWSGNGTVYNEARGHLLGAQLGGSGDVAENLVTLQQNPANSPVMRDFETSVREVVEKTGEGVNYSATPVYKATDLVPRGITLSGSGSGGFSLDVTVLNPAEQ